MNYIFRTRIVFFLRRLRSGSFGLFGGSTNLALFVPPRH